MTSWEMLLMQNKLCTLLNALWTCPKLSECMCVCASVSMYVFIHRYASRGARGQPWVSFIYFFLF